jgi:hypothetical protein
MDFVRIDDNQVVDPYEAHAPSHLVSTDARRPLSIAGHHEWRESIATAGQFNEIDEAVAAEDFAPSQRKSGKEISRLLDLLDSLPAGKDSQ